MAARKKAPPKPPTNMPRNPAEKPKRKPRVVLNRAEAKQLEALERPDPPPSDGSQAQPVSHIYIWPN